MQLAHEDTNGNVFGLISLVRYSHTVDTLSPVLLRLKTRLTTIISSSSGGPNTPRTAGESIITAGIPEAMATGPEFVGGPPWSFDTYSLGDSSGSRRRQGICQTLALTCELRGPSASRNG
jgi:hypothetical protein